MRAAKAILRHRHSAHAVRTTNMRHPIAVAAFLLLTHAALGEAIAGRTHILVIERCTEYWVPIAGGAVEPIHWQPWHSQLPCGDAVSAAYDGERFLINYGGVRAAFFDEGEPDPASTVELDNQSSATSSLVEWDGTRYVAVWRRSAGRGGRLMGAALTPQGVVIDEFQLTGSRRAAGLAVLPAGPALVLDAPGDDFTAEFPEPNILQVTAIYLDQKLTPRKELRVGSSHERLDLGGRPMQYVDVLDAAAFAGQFYVTWIDTLYEWGGNLDSDATVFGARIAADGTLLDGPTPVAFNAPSTDVDLITIGEYLLAVVKREGLGRVTGALIDRNGVVVATRELLAERVDDADYGMIIETVRLPDGRVALLTKRRFNPIATVTPINPPTPPGGRRRAARH